MKQAESDADARVAEDQPFPGNARYLPEGPSGKEPQQDAGTCLRPGGVFFIPSAREYPENMLHVSRDLDSLAGGNPTRNNTSA